VTICGLSEQVTLAEDDTEVHQGVAFGRCLHAFGNHQVVSGRRDYSCN